MKVGSRVLGFGYLISLLLAVVTLLIYLPVRHHSFLLFDDADYVWDNRMVQAGLTWAGAKWAFLTFHAGNWHPLTWLSHMLDAQLFGPGPAGPHIVNLLLHIANTLLLFVLLRRLTGALWRSAVVAALFALHPLHVESVTWIAERKDVLSAFFFLLTLWAYARYVESFASQNPQSKAAWYACTWLLFALGLMSKPMLVTLPCVLLLLDFWPLRRVPTRQLVLEKIPFFVLSVVSCVVTFTAQKQSGVVRTLAGLPIGERVENTLVSYARYLGKIVWPTDLAAFYPHPGHWPVGQVVFATILMLILCLAVAWFDRKAPFAVTGWLWFLGMLVPTIGLVQVSVQSMADRYTYLPAIGVFIVIVWGATELIVRWRLPKWVGGMVAALAVVACAVQTGMQLRHWRDNESLFRHTLAVTTRNFAAHYNLAAALLEKGQVDEAVIEFERTLEIWPDYADAHCNFGNALLRKGRVDDALTHFRKTLELQPDHALARSNLGLTLLQQGKVDEAIDQFQKALEVRADDVAAHFNLSNALLQVGRTEEAIARYRTTLGVRADHVDAHNNLGAALLQVGRADEAVSHFQKALEILPGHANAANNLADVFLQRGQLDDAITQYRSGLASQPGNAGAHCNLGTALLLKGNSDEAAPHFEKALEIQPDLAQAHNNLGFILLQKRRVAEAVVHLRAALKVQPDNARTSASLAWVLATCPDDSVRNGASAIELAQRARQLSESEDPDILRSLAAAYAEGGKFTEAVQAAQRALQLADARSDAPLAGALRSQLKLYQAGSPFRDVSL